VLLERRRGMLAAGVGKAGLSAQNQQQVQACARWWERTGVLNVHGSQAIVYTGESRLRAVACWKPSMELGGGSANQCAGMTRKSNQLLCEGLYHR